MTYTRANRRKCDLRAHIVLACKYRRPALSDAVSGAVKKALCELAIERQWEVIAAETDVDHVHILLRYDATERISDIVAAIKLRTTRAAWEAHPAWLVRWFWKKRALWSDGYFACSAGDASAETIRSYIENQG